MNTRTAGYQACIDLGLPMTDGAFVLIHDIETSLTEWTAERLVNEESIEEWLAWVADWPSGSGVISVYTMEQVTLWRDLHAWQADLSDFTQGADREPAVLIGRELQGITWTIARAMADVVEEMP